MVSVGGALTLMMVDCLLDSPQDTDSVSEGVAAAAPLEFDADGCADEASWMAGGGREVEAAKTGEESSMIAGGGRVDWSSSSCTSLGPDAGDSAGHLASGWLAGLSL